MTSWTRFAAAALAASLFAAGGCDDGGEDPITCPTGTTYDGEVCRFDCPPGWTRQEGGAKQCAPSCPEQFSPTADYCAPACPPGSTADGMACEPDGLDEIPAGCPSGDDLYDSEGAAGTVIAVDQATGSADGDGTQLAPFATLGQALAAADASGADEVSILLGAGDYEPTESISGPGFSTLRILGRCAEETRVLASGASSPLMILRAGLEVDIRRVGFSGSPTAVFVNAASSLSITDSTFTGWSETGGAVSWLGSDAEERLVVQRSRFVGGASDAISVQKIEEVILTENVFETASELSAVQISEPTDVEVRSNRFDGSGAWGLQLDLEGGGVAVVADNRLTGTWNHGIAVDEIGRAHV